MPQKLIGNEKYITHNLWIISKYIFGVSFDNHVAQNTNQNPMLWKNYFGIVFSFIFLLVFRIGECWKTIQKPLTLSL